MTALTDFLGFQDDDLTRLAREMTRGDRRLIDKLIEIRQRHDMTQQHLADLMGVTQSAVAKFENGPRDPRLSTIRRYALALGVEVTHHVSGEVCSAVDDMVRRSGTVVREVEGHLFDQAHRPPAAWHPGLNAHTPGPWEADFDVPLDADRSAAHRRARNHA